MRAVRLAKFGLENLQVEEVADPVAGPGEVLIATDAATINPADQMMVAGGMASFLPDSITPPYTPAGTSPAGWLRSGRA